MTSRLVEFYTGRGTDARGRRIDAIWSMSLDDLEYTHDYIQWLFPLRERSSVEPGTPTLDDAAIDEFRSTAMRERLVRSAEVMAAFYGFLIERDGESWRLEPAPNAKERQGVWLSPGNHNFLRLTRIMKSLATLGLSDLSRAWLDMLREVYNQNATVVGARTWQFWEAAPRVT
jgi:Opioid growth factor receptor (OGFr) conserved region